MFAKAVISVKCNLGQFGNFLDRWRPTTRETRTLDFFFLSHAVAAHSPTFPFLLPLRRRPPVAAYSTKFKSRVVSTPRSPIEAASGEGGGEISGRHVVGFGLLVAGRRPPELPPDHTGP